MFKKFILAPLLIAILLGVTTISIRAYLERSETSKSTFTWIAYPINNTFATWLSNLGFTDVVVRYVTDVEAEASKQLLDSYNIRFWRHVFPTVFDNCSTKIDFNTVLAREIQQSPSKLILIDDTQLLMWHSNFTLFLQAVEPLSDYILLCYGAWAGIDELITYNLSKVNVEMYCEPDRDVLGMALQLKIRCKSLGVHLWIWNGSGWGWNGLNQSWIKHVYWIAGEVGAERVCVWNGYEDDGYEQGMYESSLYNFLEHWGIIESENRKFLT